jgi:uncharacterized protein
VNFTSLMLVLIVVSAAMGTALVIQMRWFRRFQRKRKLRRLDRELGVFCEQLRMPTPAQSWRERVLFALALFPLLCVAWGFVEPNWIEVTEHRIISPKLRAKTRIRVVHLSDIHSEASAHIEPQVVARVADLKPDLILFTGDALNEEAGVPVFRKTIAALAKIAPTYAVRGNWETWWFPDLDLYGNTGAHPLDGRAEAVVIRGQTLWLVGVGVDRETQLAPAMAQVPKGSFTVLLHHFPALAPRAAELGLDVMLAGDTHGGQVRLPLLGEVVRIERHGFWRSSGMHRERSMWLYVSRGLGNEAHAPRIRFACRPEIGVLLFEASD